MIEAAGPDPSHGAGMRTHQPPRISSARPIIEEAAKAVYIAERVDDGLTDEWARAAWEDMGNGEPTEERALLEVAVANTLKPMLKARGWR